MPIQSVPFSARGDGGRKSPEASAPPTTGPIKKKPQRGRGEVGIRVSRGVTRDDSEGNGHALYRQVTRATSTAAMKSRKLVTSRKLALMASKGCVLVNWRPRHQQDEEPTGEEASTGGADTEPNTRHLSRPNVAAAQEFDGEWYAGLWLRPL